jgi:malate dehydrogenase (oxaloacetate-decarboxylating)
MDDLRDFQRPYAKSRRLLGINPGQRVQLLEAIGMAAPTILLGCSTMPGAFTREVIDAMCAATERPLIFPLSNPTSRMEADPADVLEWSAGKALVAAGSPVPPVDYRGTLYRIGQSNNALVFPGIGLGAVVDPDPVVLPPIDDLSAISALVGAAVYRAAVDDGVATKSHDDLGQTIRDARWVPEYT